MTLSLDSHPVFQGRSGPVLVVVADGVGIAPDAPHNAVTQASTPTLDALLDSDLSTQLAAHGTAVGLPTDDDMGNSEVGHNAIGAGRIFAQGAKLVNKALESGSIFFTDIGFIFDTNQSIVGFIHIFINIKNLISGNYRYLKF